jgi:hypothetical protein
VTDSEILIWYEKLEEATTNTDNPEAGIISHVRWLLSAALSGIGSAPRIAAMIPTERLREWYNEWLLANNRGHLSSPGWPFNMLAAFASEFVSPAHWTGKCEMTRPIGSEFWHIFPLSHIPINNAGGQSRFLYRIKAHSENREVLDAIAEQKRPIVSFNPNENAPYGFEFVFGEWGEISWRQDETPHEVDGVKVTTKGKEIAASLSREEKS